MAVLVYMSAVWNCLHASTVPQSHGYTVAMSCYIDDTLITGAEHLHNLEEVLSRLKQHGLRVKPAMCKFLVGSVEYLGHRIDSTGLHSTDGKLQAILQASTLQSVTFLLGVSYNKFIPSLATTLHPLNQLLREDHRWRWNKVRSRLLAAKEGVTSSCVLVHYNPNLPIRMAGDASAYGVGMVISHVMPDGSEQPIAFTSRTLSNSERNYSQIRKACN